MSALSADRLVDLGHRLVLPSWLRAIGVGNLLGTVALLVLSIGLVDTQPHRGGPLAFLMLWLSILPLLAARRFPGAAAVAVAAGTLLTQLVIGPLVTCGVVLPVIFAMVFQLGSRLISSAQLAVGGIGVLATAAVELALDPVLGVEAAVFIAGLATTFFLGGLMVRSRVRMAQILRRRTDELTEHRERTAAVAVEADRERIGSDLELTIRSAVSSISEAAASARSSVDDPTLLRASFAEIELQGREALAAMREIVGSLRDAPTEPPPGLRDLGALVQRATESGAPVRMIGGIRSLPPNLELTAYRIVEQLLTTLADDRLLGVDVVITFATDAVTLDVSGSPRPVRTTDEAARVSAALTAARTRAEVLGGRLDASIGRTRQLVTVSLPTPTASPAVLR